MKAEILSCGTELLLGSILNTNARFIGQKLAENAIDVYRQTTVGDNVARLVECFESAARRSDLIICSGGLGPTEDDVTAAALAQFLNLPLVIHHPTVRFVKNQLKKRGVRMTPLIARQCRVPRGAVILPNLRGTAPGILCRAPLHGQDKWFLLLPGPPREMQPMLVGQALPRLLRLAKIKRQRFKIRRVKIAGLNEADVAGKVTDFLKLRPPLTVGIYARPGEVELTIMSKAATERRASGGADAIERKIRARFGHKVFGADEQTLASVVGELLRKKRKTLSAAESCTGGLFSDRVSDVPGSSAYFIGSLVSYHNRVKQRLLSVPERDLKKYGAVSAVVAEKMAQNVRRLFGADYGIGITGIAGPGGGSAKKPVGLAFIAFAGSRQTTCSKYRFFGTRREIKARVALQALDLLRLRLISDGSH